jgi:cardiolipin synthase
MYRRTTFKSLQQSWREIKVKEKDIFTIPNIMSLTRMFLAIPIIWCIVYEDSKYFKLIYLLIGLAIITDFLDGWLAKKLNQQTNIGRFLDAFADKVVIDLVTIVLVFYREFPVWLAGLIVLRDISLIMSGLFVLKKYEYYVHSNLIGKWTSFFLSLLIITFIFNIDMLKNYAIAVSVTFLVLSCISYLISYVGFGKKDLFVK